MRKINKDLFAKYGLKDGTSTGHEDIVRNTSFATVTVHSAQLLDNGCLVRFTEHTLYIGGEVSKLDRVAYIKGDRLIWNMITD